MNFKTNLNELSLLGNIPITIEFNSKTIRFIPPNIKLSLLNNDFMEFYNILKQDITEFNKNIKNHQIEISTKYGIVKLILLLENNNNSNRIKDILKTLYPDIDIRGNLLYFNDIEITEEEFDLLLDFLLISNGDKPIAEVEKLVSFNNLTVSEQAKNKKLEEFERKKRETQEKINSAKNKKNTSKEKNKEINQKGITIDQIVIAIMYEFPSFTIDRIYEMNLFTLLEFWKYISKVVDTQIQIVAAGNGNVKKFTYFIN